MKRPRYIPQPQPSVAFDILGCMFVSLSFTLSLAAFVYFAQFLAFLLRIAFGVPTS